MPALPDVETFKRYLDATALVTPATAQAWFQELRDGIPWHEAVPRISLAFRVRRKRSVPGQDPGACTARG
jgi:hypothetical protein